jgi:lipoyl synthase
VRYNEAMAQLKGIPLVTAVAAAPRSGEKYLTPQGFTAIRDGVKAPRSLTGAASAKKPPWLKARAPSGSGFQGVRAIVREHRLATVCEEAKCPNIGECWNAGTATLMLMGAVCTRACRFCAVDTGNPHGWLDAGEPENAARTVELMGLRYVVLTSVDRDDLPDGGAAHFAATVREVRQALPAARVEVLTPDFCGDLQAVARVLDAGPHVFNHNIETVPRLYARVRPQADYQQSLDVLDFAQRYRPDILTKSGLMVGLGETFQEMVDALGQLRESHVQVLTVGQYLRPSERHLPVVRYWHPDEFAALERAAYRLGFDHVAAGPLVRSSYHADQHVAQARPGVGPLAAQA